MQRVGSARPTLVSSASKFCRYSTENAPRPPRQLVKEWGGIVIPSREEIQQTAAAARKKAEAQKPSFKTDISYLKNASERSLAGRLARAETNPQPKPPAVTLSREEVEAITRKRREARLAREAEREARLEKEANAVLRDFSPAPALSKAVFAAFDTPGPLPQFHQQGNIIPEISRRPPVKTREAPVRRVADKGEIPIKPFANSDLREQGSASILDARENPPSQTNKKPQEITETHPPSQRELLSAAMSKRREDRLRRETRGTAFSQRNTTSTSASATESIADFEAGFSSSRREDLAASIAKRREERLRRQLEGENPQHERRTGFSSSNRQRSGPRQSSNSNQRRANARAEPEQDLGISVDLEAEAEVPGNFLPEFNGPKAISKTLSEIFGSSSSTAISLSNQLTVQPSAVAADYSHYVSRAMKPLFSTPPEELGPVNFAKLTLSHRAGISLPKRRQAVDIISHASSRARPTAKAQAQAAA